MEGIGARALTTTHPMGPGLVHGLLAGLTQRIAFAFGLVVGIAMLGAIAFTARTDVRVLWFDERGHLTIGMLRTDTQQRLEEALRELGQSTQLLESEKAQKLEAERTTEQRLREAHQAALADKDRHIEHLKSQLQAGPKFNEYQVTRIGDQLHLPLRDRPERASRILTHIPANAAGVISACKLAAYEDAVFVEVSYQGVTGWVSGYYLASFR